MKALKKTITYRILAGVGGALIMLIVTGGNPIAVTTGSLLGEVYRTGAYYFHEKAWEENPKLAIKNFKKEEDERLHKEFMKHFEG